MLRVLLCVFTLGLFLMPVSASAIPICPAGTMADYLGFGSTGCQFNSLTFSHFSYTNFGGVTLSPLGISVAPRSDPQNLGSGGAALHMTPFPLFPDTDWNGVIIGFDVAGPGTLRNDVSARLHTFADLQIAVLHVVTAPGGSLGGGASFADCRENPNCNVTSSSISFPATPVQTVFISGVHFSHVDAGFATPEPATLLLVGTGAAGLGLVRWWNRRRSSDDDHPA